MDQYYDMYGMNTTNMYNWYIFLVCELTIVTVVIIGFLRYTAIQCSY